MPSHLRTAGTVLVLAVTTLWFMAVALTARQALHGAALALLKRVEVILGASPANCGRFMVAKVGQPPASHSDLRTAVACVQEHAARRAPAWMLVERQGIDSWVADGVFVTHSGEVRAFSYDSDPSGGSGLEARLSTRPCIAIGVGQDSAGRAEIRCEAE